MQIMKKVLLYCAALLLTPLFGCVKDGEPKDCYQILYFDYRGDGADDIFQEKIGQVNLYIYNRNNTLVQKNQISKRELEVLQGVRLNLPSGKYDVVCWGNAYANTIISDDSSVSTGMIHTAWNNSGTRRDGVFTTNDSLYYGTREIEIVSRPEKSDTVHFKSAHIKMKVALTGLENSALADGSSPVEIRVDNLCPDVDFLFNFPEADASYYPVTVLNRQIDDFEADFNVLRFDDRNDIVIRLFDKASGDALHHVNLSEFMSLNDITVNNINEAFVGIRFLFNGADISVNPWKEENVIPGI